MQESRTVPLLRISLQLLRFVIQIWHEIKLTAVFRKFMEGYAAFVEEVPGAITQGATLEEARENLKEEVEMVLQANRDDLDIPKS